MLILFLDVNECDSVDTPCLYGGTCRNVYGGYECDCVEGYTGPRCGKGKRYHQGSHQENMSMQYIPP